MTNQTRTAFAAVRAAKRRADHRQVGELVRFPCLNGSHTVPRVGIVEQITCVTPDLPYHDRTLEFVIALDYTVGIIPPTARRERIRVNVGYQGIESLDG